MPESQLEERGAFAVSTRLLFPLESFGLVTDAPVDIPVWLFAGCLGLHFTLVRMKTVRQPESQFSPSDAQPAARKG